MMGCGDLPGQSLALRRARFVAIDQIYVEVGVVEGGVDEGIGVLPRGVRAHLVAVPTGEMDDLVFREFG